MRIKKKKVIILSIILFVLMGVVYVIYKNPVPVISLSEEEIEALREIYPVNDDTPPNADMVEATFEQYIDRCNCFVVAEIVSEADKYYKKGIVSDAFIKYEVRIIRDVWDNIEQDTVEMSYNSMFDVGMPSMDVGSKFIIGGSYNSETSMLGITSYTMFYVTDDGYVLSVKSEESKNRHTGSTVDNIINYIKRVK